MEVSVQLTDNKVSAYSFTGAGCAISMASADMLGDMIEGLTLEEVLKLNKDELYEMLGIEISLRRSKCALLPLLALQNGILEYNGISKRSWTHYHN